MATIVVFALVSGFQLMEGLFLPAAIGSHATNYTEAAAAWLAGGDPWLTGPPAAVFAGPPTMLLIFVPFVQLPVILTKVILVGGTLLLAAWTVRRLGLPGFWLGFPPIFQAVFLGHPEVLALWLVVAGGPLAGLAAIVKPYVALPLIAERRWTALLVGAVALVITAPILPWVAFVDRLPTIGATLQRQSHGDSVFGEPILMLVAVGALLAVGWRRGLWLAGPLLWPNSQPIYKAVAVPALSPFLGIAWAIPIPGLTLLGVVVEALVVRRYAGRHLPRVLRPGFGLAGEASPLHRPPASW